MSSSLLRISVSLCCICICNPSNIRCTICTRPAGFCRSGCCSCTSSAPVGRMLCVPPVSAWLAMMVSFMVSESSGPLPCAASGPKPRKSEDVVFIVFVVVSLTPNRAGGAPFVFRVLTLIGNIRQVADVSIVVARFNNNWLHRCCRRSHRR